MSEPRTTAKRIHRVLPDVWRWHVADDRIGGSESDAYAVVEEGRVVLIDPLPVDEVPLKGLGQIEAIVLTASCHQRSSWRFRRAFSVPVYAPESAQGLDEEPDHSYTGGDLLPGGLIAFHAPGPTEAMYVLWKSRPVSVVFLADVLMHDGSGVPGFVPGEYQDEPGRTRASVRRILADLPVTALCFEHGPPILEGARQALTRALEEDSEMPAQPPQA